MSEPATTPREKLLRRIEELTRGPVGPEPLKWSDIAFLAHGMAFASGPMELATRAVTSGHDLGPRGTWVLNLISLGIDQPNELADIIDISRSLMSVELSRLAAAGLIEVRPVEKDRRRSELTLTRRGKAALRQVQDDVTRLIIDALGHYSPEQLRTCGQILADMRNAMKGSDSVQKKQRRPRAE